MNPIQEQILNYTDEDARNLWMPNDSYLQLFQKQIDSYPVPLKEIRVDKDSISIIGRDIILSSSIIISLKNS